MCRKGQRHNFARHWLQPVFIFGQIANPVFDIGETAAAIEQHNRRLQAGEIAQAIRQSAATRQRIKPVQRIVILAFFGMRQCRAKLRQRTIAIILSGAKRQQASDFFIGLGFGNLCQQRIITRRCSFALAGSQRVIANHGSDQHHNGDRQSDNVAAIFVPCPGQSIAAQVSGNLVKNIIFHSGSPTTLCLLLEHMCVFVQEIYAPAHHWHMLRRLWQFARPNWRIL